MRLAMRAMPARRRFGKPVRAMARPITPSRKPPCHSPTRLHDPRAAPPPPSRAVVRRDAATRTRAVRRGASTHAVHSPRRPRKLSPAFTSWGAAKHAVRTGAGGISAHRTLARIRSSRARLAEDGRRAAQPSRAAPVAGVETRQRRTSTRPRYRRPGDSAALCSMRWGSHARCLGGYFTARRSGCSSRRATSGACARVRGRGAPVADPYARRGRAAAQGGGARPAAMRERQAVAARSSYAATAARSFGALRRGA